MRRCSFELSVEMLLGGKKGERPATIKPLRTHDDLIRAGEQQHSDGCLVWCGGHDDTPQKPPRYLSSLDAPAGLHFVSGECRKWRQRVSDKIASNDQLSETERLKKEGAHAYLDLSKDLYTLKAIGDDVVALLGLDDFTRIMAA